VTKLHNNGFTVFIVFEILLLTSVSKATIAPIGIFRSAVIMYFFYLDLCFINWRKRIFGSAFRRSQSKAKGFLAALNYQRNNPQAITAK